MEPAQRELLAVLLGRVLSLGLISKATHSGAVDLVYSAADLPELFGAPARPAEEVDRHGDPSHTQ